MVDKIDALVHGSSMARRSRRARPGIPLGHLDKAMAATEGKIAFEDDCGLAQKILSS